MKTFTLTGVSEPKKTYGLHEIESDYIINQYFDIRFNLKKLGFDF